jgi:tRNA pseudouridine38-40 synthase
MTCESLIRYVTHRIFTYSYCGNTVNGWSGKELGLFFIKNTFEHLIQQITGCVVKLCTAARTDSGVHAVHNICNGRIEHNISNYRLMQAMNFYLPEYIRILDIHYTHACFSSRFWAKSRCYEYLIYTGNIVPPLLVGRVLRVATVNIQLMQQAHAYLIHMQSVRSFCLTTFAESMYRPMLHVHSYYKQVFTYTVIAFYFESKSFVHHQIRITMYYLIQVGLGRLSLEQFQQMVHATYEQPRGVITSDGLYLIQVKY